jgi:hypothetical protein
VEEERREPNARAEACGAHLQAAVAWAQHSEYDRFEGHLPDGVVEGGCVAVGGVGGVSRTGPWQRPMVTVR